MVEKSVTVREIADHWEFHFTKARKMPRWMKKASATYDTITALKKGKAWTYEYMIQYQPRTAAQLLSGGEFVLVAREMSTRDGRGYLSHLVQEVNGQAVEIGRLRYGNNPDDATYQTEFEKKTRGMTRAWGRPMVPDQRYLSLPIPLRMAYYYRINGMNIPASWSFGIYGRILPVGSQSKWTAVDEILGDFRLKKKVLPLLEERIPGIRPDTRDMPYTNFMMFLCSNGSFEASKRREGDYFFVKNHIQDGVVYYVRDADFENMMILEDPGDAIDRYCEHVLLRSGTRFDFRPWAVPFVSPNTQ